MDEDTHICRGCRMTGTLAFFTPSTWPPTDRLECPGCWGADIVPIPAESVGQAELARAAVEQIAANFEQLAAADRGTTFADLFADLGDDEGEE